MARFDTQTIFDTCIQGWILYVAAIVSETFDLQADIGLLLTKKRYNLFRLVDREPILGEQCECA